MPTHGPAHRHSRSTMDTSAPSQPVRLRILTFPQQAPEPACTGDGYTCPCQHHELERRQAVTRGVRPRKPQPWQSRPAA